MSKSKENEKRQSELLKDTLFMNPKKAIEIMSDDEIAKSDKFCEEYKKFLDASKTERETITYTVSLAQKNGFEEFIQGKKYNAGDKVYFVNRGKAMILAVIGNKSISNGVHIAAAHVDAPHIDLKPNPLYEQNDMAFFKTHYYGGIKKYQWITIPLAMHGCVARKDGTQVNISIGEEPNEPQFCMTDLLPHLSREQSAKPLSKAIEGEELNVLIGSRPFKDDKGSDLVKLNIMKLINEKYGIVEQDFYSAEIEMVPAFKASDIGFDRSMIGSYGHDDRVCAYTSLKALFDIETPELTSVVVFADKEETGSEGNTGLRSSFFKYFIADLADMEDVKVRHVLSKSKCLSADVNAAFDPSFSSPFEPKNSSYINGGAVITKYTGAGGKYDTNDASAEYTAKIRNLLDENNVLWQTGELGKVDAGGGGTVAKYIGNLDVDTIDLGVPVLSMHSPFEIVSKTDVYMTYRAVFEFFRSDF